MPMQDNNADFNRNAGKDVQKRLDAKFPLMPIEELALFSQSHNILVTNGTETGRIDAEVQVNGPEEEKTVRVIVNRKPQNWPISSVTFVSAENKGWRLKPSSSLE